MGPEESRCVRRCCATSGLTGGNIAYSCSTRDFWFGRYSRSRVTIAQELLCVTVCSSRPTKCVSPLFNLLPLALDRWQSFLNDATPTSRQFAWSRRHLVHDTRSHSVA